MVTPKHARGLADMLATAEVVNLDDNSLPGWLTSRAMSTGSTRVILLSEDIAKHIAEILNTIASMNENAEAE